MENIGNATNIQYAMMIRYMENHTDVILDPKGHGAEIHELSTMLNSVEPEHQRSDAEWLKKILGDEEKASNSSDGVQVPGCALPTFSDEEDEREVEVVINAADKIKQYSEFAKSKTSGLDQSSSEFADKVTEVTSAKLGFAIYEDIFLISSYAVVTGSERHPRTYF
ncbi:hypothetical protein QAD02_019383 [Eretmocerus hayati]|uniref:Uncharacterized protein n=1 Tax=Eretmocerus hayati TaxID=131215 RepID=A0ACC2PLA0_9HYME|nr:hypothetical protein QAD02_019383 [Eretmocerus hayati]